MNSKVFTCILCPNGCEIETEIEYKSGEAVILRMEGNRCPRGREYVSQELKCPRRNIATSVLVKGGELPLVSVRLTSPVPRERIFDVMEVIRDKQLAAPVHIGDVIITDVLGTGADVIATKTVERG